MYSLFLLQNHNFSNHNHNLRYNLFLATTLIWTPFSPLTSTISFCINPCTLMCLLPNNIQYNGYLQMETQLIIKLQMNYLQMDN